MGSIAGNMMALIVLSEKSAGMENLEVSKFVVALQCYMFNIWHLTMRIC